MSAANARLDADRRLLGVAVDADPEAVRRAFRLVVKQVHPDRVGGDGEQLRDVIEAFRRLEAVAVEPARVQAEAESARLEITVAQAVAGGWTVVEPAGGQALSVRLPAGLRAGEQVRVSGVTFRVAITRLDGVSVLGDNILMIAEVSRTLLDNGGRMSIQAPIGEMAIWISRADGARRFVRLPGQGLPARGVRPAGDLILTLKLAADAVFDTPVQAKRRRFAQAWSA